MKQINSFKDRVSNVQSNKFDALAIDIFLFQSQYNEVYKKYITHLGVNPLVINSVEEIPFLPIDFFKHHAVKTKDWQEEKVFLSSGTSGMVRSKHFIQDLGFYQRHSKMIFERLYGEMNDIVFFALLPSYQEQGNSSLISMVDFFINHSASGPGGYYLNDDTNLLREIRTQLSASKKVILIGVGYALLDLCELNDHPLDGLIVVETGGMKGRREDMTKDEFYAIMKERLGSIHIHSEYGMTELLSQAYSSANGSFRPPFSMKVLVRDINDPFTMLQDNQAGGINVIDLANVHSCAFIETKDLGRNEPDGTFEILGRIDNSDLRGCNLLVV